ncbi:MAG: hypothetical protein ACRD2A_19620 [Vicinamibacterales bacterium]
MIFSLKKIWPVWTGVPADVHLHVDVRRPAAVPAWEDRQELGLAGCVRPLVAAQEPRRRTVDGGVAEGVALPDLDVRVLDRLAGLRVQHREADHERKTGLPLGVEVGVHVVPFS